MIPPLNQPEYYWQKPHYDLCNRIVHSKLYKTIFNPIRQRFDYTPEGFSQRPFYMGIEPTSSWLYGHLDYSFNKIHRHY